VPILEHDQLFAAPFPDPIQLYYSLAYANYQFAKKARNNITIQKQQPQFLNFVSNYLYNWHLQYKISTIIFLHSTIEAFVNHTMPEDFIYKQYSSGSKSDKFLKLTKEYNKEQTERYIQFKEKLGPVISQLTKIDFQNQHQKIYDKILSLNKLRNDLIHLRSTISNNEQEFEKVFVEVVNVNLTPFVNAVKDFINTVKPGFIEFEEIKPSKNESRIDFRFETLSAFKVDISVFLKILEVPYKKVILNIPITKDDELQNTLNWVMQNLDIMAKEQLINFPSIRTTQDKIEIEIIKTDKKLGEK